MNRHPIMVEGFVCHIDPRSNAVWGFALDRMSQGKLVLGDDEQDENKRTPMRRNDQFSLPGIGLARHGERA